MALYEDIFDDNEKIKSKQEYFYVMKYDSHDDNIPAFVYPDFQSFFLSMIAANDLDREKPNFGRLKIKSDIFSARLPMLKRFFNRQEETMQDFNESLETLSPLQMPEDILYKNENLLFGPK